MPVIPKDAVSNVLKPDKAGATLGEQVDFVIIAPHKSNSGGTSGTLYSIPVKTKDVEGDFPLNKTHMSMFIAAMGDNSDTWPKWRFKAFVVPQNNPQSGKQVHSWAVIPTSFVAPKGSAK